MCRKKQLIGIIVFSAGAGFILSSLLAGLALRIMIGITLIAIGLILLKQ